MPTTDQSDRGPQVEEVARLRELLSSAEQASATALHQLLKLRDTVKGLEAELGTARGHAVMLERELVLRDRVASHLAITAETTQPNSGRSRRARTTKAK